jgi:hypothetical protein
MLILYLSLLFSSLSYLASSFETLDGALINTGASPDDEHAISID